jgi:hypothetical protein
MNTTTSTATTPIRRMAAATATAMLLLGCGALSASASQDPGTPLGAPAASSSQRCPLERVGTQYVRCDDLTGNGVPAPTWLPER